MEEEKKERDEGDEEKTTNIGRYSHFVAHYPWALIAIDIMIAGICGPVAVWQFGVPDFKEPTKGFEPRGTSLAGRRLAISHLSKALINGSLSYGPGFSHWDPARDHLLVAATGRHIEKKDAPLMMTLPCLHKTIPNHGQGPRIVLESSQGRNLLTPEHLHAVCRFQQDHMKTFWPSSRCNVLSLPGTLSTLYSIPCQNLTQHHINLTLDRLHKCSQYYYRLHQPLNDRCMQTFNPVTKSSQKCPGIPYDCMEHNAVYDIMHYFTDNKFLSNQTSSSHLTYTVLFFPRSWTHNSTKLRDYYLNHLSKADLSDEPVDIVAMNLNVKDHVFKTYVKRDLPFYGLAMGLVILLIVIYLRSFVLMFTVVINLAFTLSVAYFLYFMILRFVFFPFMSMMTGLLIIAIGADDVFILHDIWSKYLLETPNRKLEDATSHMLHHGAMSIFVTSFTTAAALFVNIVHDITAIKCFGVFASLCVLVNFYFMITLVPSIIIIIEKTQACCFQMCFIDYKCYGDIYRRLDKLSHTNNVLWGQTIASIVTSAWFVWLPLFLFIGIGGLVVVFAYPKLSLPRLTQYQLLADNHPFEVYDNTMKQHFRFEEHNKQRSVSKVGVQFIWGLQDKDNGKTLDPDDRGSLIFDENFNAYKPASQEYMLKFCESLLSYNLTDSKSGYKCSMGMFKDVIEGSCNKTFHGKIVSYSPCCELKFPLNSSMARICYNSSIVWSTIAKLQMQKRAIGSFVFDDQDNIKAVQFLVSLDRQWTAIYEEMDTVYKDINSFLNVELQNAPDGMHNGWFGGATFRDFYFYDLHDSLAHGTFTGITISLSIGCLVLLFTSCNVLITLYAIITIGFSIAVTVAGLVLQGWELNVNESVSITLAVGLSIDFTIHLGVAYKLSKHPNRKDRVQEAIATVGSAVTMAALTTFVSGAAICAASVRSYKKFGIFLMLVIAISWAFAMFFFLPLCCAIGPNENFGDLCSIRKKKEKTKQNHHQNGVKRLMTTYKDDSLRPLRNSQTFPPWEKRDTIHCLKRNKSIGDTSEVCIDKLTSV